jgi:hypothetical protein
MIVTKKMLEKRCKTDSLLLIHLTPAEYERFEKSSIPYSGSTGKYANPEDYGGIAPYIATFFYCLPRAIKVLGWKRTNLRFEGVNWFLKGEG